MATSGELTRELMKAGFKRKEVDTSFLCPSCDESIKASIIALHDHIDNCVDAIFDQMARMDLQLDEFRAVLGEKLQSNKRSEAEIKAITRKTRIAIQDLNSKLGLEADTNVSPYIRKLYYNNRISRVEECHFLLSGEDAKVVEQKMFYLQQLFAHLKTHIPEVVEQVEFLCGGSGLIVDILRALDEYRVSHTVTPPDDLLLKNWNFEFDL